MRKKKRSKKTYNSSSKNFLIVVLLLIVAILFTGKTFLQKQESQSNNVLGLLLAKGDDDSDSSSGSDSSGSDNSGSGSSSSSGSGSSSSGSSGGSNIIPTQTKIINPTTGVRTETEVKQEEERTEIRDDRIVINAEQEDGTEVELEDDAIFKIEERLATDQIKIATDEANRFIIQRGTAGAVSEFPLSIDLATNTLIINTPSGQKNVAVLPDQAVQNLLIANIVSRLGGSTVVNSFRTGETSTLAQVITLGEQNGIPIYEINGISDQRLLGFVPVTIEKTIAVSAETGAVVSTQVSFVNKVLDFLSF